MESRIEPTQAFVDLQITDKIFPLVMGSLRDANLSDKESRYLSYLVGICGTRGCTFRKKETIATELGKGTWTISRIEKSLVSKGRLIIFDYGNKTYRSPYPRIADQFLSSQKPRDALVEPTEQSCQVPPNKTVKESPQPEPTKPALEAAQTIYQQAPIRQYKLDKVQQPVQAELSTRQEYQVDAFQPVDKCRDWFQQPKKEKNPYNKNRYLVQQMTNDICETLNSWKSWKWIAKQIWSVSEEAEQHLYNAVAWVREETECCRCHSVIGLLTWKLRADGIIP